LPTNCSTATAASRNRSAAAANRSAQHHWEQMLHEPSRVGAVVDLLPHHRRSRTNTISAAVAAPKKENVSRGFVGSGGEG
jgi:hypothetical protein